MSTISEKREIERLLAFEEQFKQEIKITKQQNEKQIIEYESKIRDLEKLVATMTKSTLSSEFSTICSVGTCISASLGDNESSMPIIAIDNHMTNQNLNSVTKFHFYSISFEEI